jgi:TonB family protein
MSIERRVPRHVPLAVSLGRQTRQRGVFRGLGLSAVVHLVLIGLALWGTHHIAESDGDPGDGSSRDPGGGGGAPFAVLVLAPAQPSAPPPPALTVPSLAALTIPMEQPPEAVPEQVSAADLARLAQATGVGTGGGPGSGTGSGGGSGSGVGPGVGSDSGAGGHGTYFMPQPQGVVLPPTDRPASVRGDTVVARFEISATGEVLRVTLEPTLPDRRFQSAFLERLRRWAFTPAHSRDGRPVPGVYEVRFPL